MMKTKANIKKNRAIQEFDLSVRLKGNAETLEELERLIGRFDRTNGRRGRKTDWRWRVAYLLLLGIFLLNFPQLAVRAFSG